MPPSYPHPCAQPGGENYADVLKRQLALLDEFPNAPFTLQRLCELLIAPRAMYATSTRKLMNAVEKLLTVSSAVPTMQVALDPRFACWDVGPRPAHARSPRAPHLQQPAPRAQVAPGKEGTYQAATEYDLAGFAGEMEGPGANGDEPTAMEE